MQPSGSDLAHSLRDQLAPVSPAFHERRAYIQPVSQVTLRLKPGENGDRFHATVKDILRWLNNRAGKKLPEEAWDLKSFEMTEVGAQRTAAVGLADLPYWAARLDDADKRVARRTWVTEIGVGLEDNRDVIFGTRIICVARGEHPDFSPTVPGFVRSILAAGHCELDGQSADGKPLIVDTYDDVAKLVALLEQRDRIADVIVLAQQEEDGNSPQTILNAKSLATSLQGIAHVVVLSSAGSFALTDRVGKDLSVFRQAVRTYRPRFRAWLDDPGRHPLATPARIQRWNGGVAGFGAHLRDHAISDTVYVPGREERLPSFTTIRQIAARLERENARASGASDSELLKLFEEENRRLTDDLKEQREQSDLLLEEAERERDSAHDHANGSIAQTMLARERIRKLEERIKELTGKPQEAPIPESLAGFEEWCNEHLAGYVVITNRAYQGVKKSAFHDPSQIYRALLTLRDHYVPMRMLGGADLQAAYDRALRDLHVEESLTGDGVKFEGDEYTVQYNGARRELDRHLKSGNSRDPRYCFRLYFFWDEESQVVVVGWLPSHLENRLS